MWEPRIESGDAIKKRAAALVRMTIGWTPISLWLASGRFGLAELAAVIWLMVGYGWLAAASVREEPLRLSVVIPASVLMFAPVTLALPLPWDGRLTIAGVLGVHLGAYVSMLARFAVDASRMPTHQSIARVTRACGTWLVAASALAVLPHLPDVLRGEVDGRTVLAFALLFPGFTLAISGAFLRARAARFLRRARDGAIPGWAVVSRKSLPRPTGALLEWDAHGGGDMVLVRLGADRGYRDTEHAVPVAYV